MAAGLFVAAVALPQESLTSGECLIGAAASCELLTSGESLTSGEYLVSVAAGGGGGGGACSVVSDRLLTANVSQATDDYINLATHAQATSETALLGFLTPTALTASNLHVRVLTAPSAGDTWQITLRDDGVNTALTCDITGTAVDCSDSANSVSIDVGSALTILVDSSTGTANPDAPGHMTFSFCVDDS